MRFSLLSRSKRPFPRRNTPTWHGHHPALRHWQFLVEISDDCRLSIVWRGSRIGRSHMATMSGTLGGMTPRRPQRKTDEFRLDPRQNCAPGRRCDRMSSVCSPCIQEILLHLPTCDHSSMALSRIPTNHQLQSVMWP